MTQAFSKRGVTPQTILHPSSEAAAATASATNSQVITPLFDHPIRDTSICLAADDWYYLTGTSGTPNFFFENDGIYLWKSKDLQTWLPLGKVWDIERDGTWQRAYKVLKWYKENKGIVRKGRALWAPEIHYLKGTFWLTLCMNYGGTGLLKSTTGKAEGPYEDMGQMTNTPELDASLFEDDDSTVYWVFQNGKIARMKEDMFGLAEEPRLLRPQVIDFSKLGETRAENFTSNFNPDGQPQVGFEGAFLFKHNGKYHLACADFFRRFRVPCYDMFIATADHIYGPYSPRYLAVPHAGHSTIFKDKQGHLYCTMFGNDSIAPFQQKPAIIPLGENELGMLRPSPQVVLEGGPIGRLRPVGDIAIRDPQICTGYDGMYYLVGTTELNKDDNTGIKMYRSPDLRHWEAMGFVWKIQKKVWQTDQSAGKGQNPVYKIWAPELHFVNGTYYLTYSMNWTWTGMLKSISGKPEGPYIDLGKITTDDTIHSSIFQDDDGTIYYVWQGGLFAPMNETIDGFAAEPKQLVTVDGERVGNEGAFIVKIQGKYVLGCAEWNGDNRVHGTYDLMYGVADTISGPYSSRRVAVRHGGHGTFFKTKDGKWMTTLFGNDRTAPFRQRLGIVPLHVTYQEDDLIIEPDSDSL